MAIHLSLGLHKGRPIYMSNLQPSTGNIQQFQNMKFPPFINFYCGLFLQRLRNRIRIRNKRFRSGFRSESGAGSKTNSFGSATLHFRLPGSGSTALRESHSEWKNWILTWLGAADAVVLAVAPPGGGGRRGPTVMPVVLHQVGNPIISVM